MFGNLDSWMSNILGLPIKGIGILLALLLLLGTGLIAANYFGKRIVDFWESLARENSTGSQYLFSG